MAGLRNGRNLSWSKNIPLDHDILQGQMHLTAFRVYGRAGHAPIHQRASGIGEALAHSSTQVANQRRKGERTQEREGTEGGRKKRIKQRLSKKSLRKIRKRT